MSSRSPGGPGAGTARTAPATEPALAFAVEQPGVSPDIEIRVNFGVFASREVSSAEIDRLARWLLDHVERVTIVSETRYEIGAHAEAEVHQVRILVEGDGSGTGRELERRLLARAEHWARLCIADRALQIEEP